MNCTTRTIVGTGTNRVAFEVAYFATDADHRTRWEYTATAADGTVLASGTDLGTPSHADGFDALDALLGFAGAAADRYSGAGNCGFSEAAVAAFAVIGDELTLAALEG